MSNVRCWALALLLALAFAAARAEAPPPFAALADLAGIDEVEQRLWQAGDDFDRLIARTGLVNDDAELAAYLRGIIDRLFPRLAGALRVRVLRSPMLNAFALPNGSIYINQGMLARLDNEAQLAAVLAHEGSHFTERHSMRIHDRAKSVAFVHMVTSMLGMPLPWVKDLLLASSMFGYSRDMEREADARGFARLGDAGYDLRESPQVFRHLLLELQAAGIKEPFFFATHPRLQERIDIHTELLARAAPGGRIERDDFRRRMEGLRLDNLAADLELQRPLSVIAALDFGLRLGDYPPVVFQLYGEAYRRRAGPGDEAIAEVLLQHALSQLGEHYPTHFSLGTLYLERGELASAALHLRRVLALAPAGPERSFAGVYLERIDAAWQGFDP